MKNFIFIICIFFLTCCTSLTPVVIVHDYERLNGVYGEYSFKQEGKYFDSLDVRNMSEIQRNYYESLLEMLRTTPETSGIRRVDITHDLSKSKYPYNTIDVFVLTKKAKSGYLSINSTINKELKNKNDTISKVVYILKGDTVKTEQDYKRLMSLRKSKISIVDYFLVQVEPS